jgi:AcrR family transcriptional regulator
MASEAGLRERKKLQTRQLIAETARRLFSERGFDSVTVADVAREADVSVGTVFNYFPTKEDLFYSGMDVFEARLIQAVRERPAGESVLEAFRRLSLEGTRRLREEEVADLAATGARLVSGSRALQAREREIVAHYTHELAELIAADTGRPGGDVAAAATAAALMGVQRALVAYVHDAVLAGKRGAALAGATRAEARRAFARLEAGLGDYAVKR